MMSPSRLCALAMLAAALVARPAAAQDGEGGAPQKEAPSYMRLVPMAAMRLESLSAATRTLEGGLVGSGVDITRQACQRHILSALFLDSPDGIDPDRPIDYFLLSNDPPDSLPSPAAVVPLGHGGAKELLETLRRRYRSVEGSSIKICSGPLDGSLIEPLYVAMASGNAMISPDLDPIRWMAYNLKSGTLPRAEPPRAYPVALSANGPLLGLFMELLASLDKGAVSEDATMGNTLLHIRELGVFFSSFSRIDLALSTSMSQWDVAARLSPIPDGDVARAIRRIPTPSPGAAAILPQLAPKRFAGELGAFTAALPKSNRKWIASLADNTRVVGLGTIPCAFDLDEEIRQHLGGASSSTFVIEQGAGRIGVVAATELAAPSAVEAALESYFSTNGPSATNPRMRRVVQTERSGRRVHAYNVPQSLSASSGAGMGQTSAAVSYLLGLNHIEVAVADRWLVVARGATGLINPWLEAGGPPRTDDTVESLAFSLGDVPAGEMLLGGGTAAPTAIATRLIEAIPDMRKLRPLLPHNGGGLVWRMTRSGDRALFDARLYSSEIIAFNRMRNINSSSMQDFLSQLVLRHFQQTADEASRSDRLRERARSLRSKDSLR